MSKNLFNHSICCAVVSGRVPGPNCGCCAIGVPVAQLCTSIGGPGKKNEISIGIRDDERPGAPGLLLQRLMKGHSCGLVTQKKLFDLVCGRDGEGSGEQMLALPNICEYGLTHHPQIEPCVVAGDLSVVWRIAIYESDRKAELIGIEIARCFDVSNEQLCFG